MNHKILSIFGWYGVIALLAAYALVSFNLLNAQGIIYQALNVTGSLGIVAEAVYKKDNPAAVLNIIWVFIGLIVLLRTL